MADHSGCLPFSFQTEGEPGLLPFFASDGHMLSLQPVATQASGKQKKWSNVEWTAPCSGPWWCHQWSSCLFIPGFILVQECPHGTHLWERICYSSLKSLSQVTDTEQLGSLSWLGTSVQHEAIGWACSQEAVLWFSSPPQGGDWWTDKHHALETKGTSQNMALVPLSVRVGHKGAGEELKPTGQHFWRRWPHS